jgi:hypothetical protein
MIKLGKNANIFAQEQISQQWRAFIAAIVHPAFRTQYCSHSNIVTTRTGIFSVFEYSFRLTALFQLQRLCVENRGEQMKATLVAYL